MPRTDDQMLVRFPNGLRALVQAAAKTNGRSANAEVVYRLQQTFGTDFQPIDRPSDSDRERRHEIALAAAHAAASACHEVVKSTPHLVIGNFVAGAYMDALKRLSEDHHSEGV